MKVLVLTWFAACLVLLSSGVSTHSSEERDDFLIGDRIHSAELSLTPAAADLFSAIFNPRGISKQTHEKRPLGAQFCVDVYNINYLKSITSAGRKIRDAVKIRDSSIRLYLLRNNVAELQQQFVDNFEQCGVLQWSEERLNCQVDVIADVFKSIAISSREFYWINKIVIRFRVQRLSWSLLAGSIKLEKCLAVFPNQSTVVPPKGTPATTTTSTTAPSTTAESSSAPPANEAGSITTVEEVVSRTDAETETTVDISDLESTKAEADATETTAADSSITESTLSEPSAQETSIADFSSTEPSIVAPSEGPSPSTAAADAGVDSAQYLRAFENGSNASDTSAVEASNSDESSSDA